jgi:hypothetical protein
MVAANLKRQYEQLLFNNIPAVASIEGGIRNVTWLLPGRFQDAEVASEGCRSSLWILTSCAHASAKGETRICLEDG